MSSEQTDKDNELVATHYGLENRLSAFHEILGETQAMLARLMRTPDDKQCVWNYVHLVSELEVVNDQIKVLLGIRENMEHGYRLRLNRLLRCVKEEENGNAK